MVDASIRATWMRGGTSKGLVFRRDWLSPIEDDRMDDFLLGAMGSPDSTQIDGLGGGVSTASKVMIVDPKVDEHGRVPYRFAQVAVESAVVDYGGNCGNMTVAVAAFVVNEGIITPSEPVTKFRLYNLNTHIEIDVEVPTEGTRARIEGEFLQAGVPRAGAEIVCRYLDPSGSVLPGALPTGSPQDTLHVPGLGPIEASVVDVSNPLVFIKAQDLGLGGAELPAALNSGREFLERVESIRGAAAAMLGLASKTDLAALESPGIPKLAFVSEPQDYVTSRGQAIRAAEIDIVARIMSVQRVHLSFALTGVMCTAAASLIPGTIPWQVAKPRDRPPLGISEHRVAVGHPQGISSAIIGIESVSSGDMRVLHAGVSRTARLLMAGEVHAVF